MEKSRRKVRPIARKRRNYLYLLLAILFAISTGYIFLNFPPDYEFVISNFGIPILPIFSISLSFFVFSLAAFLFKRKLQGFIFTMFIIGYLLIRFAGLTHWLFALLFLALFITIELFVLKKK